MPKYAVIKTGGKQYLVMDNDEIVVDRIDQKENGEVELPSLASFDTENGKVELGNPQLKKTVKAKVVSQLKGDKIRVAKFKAKVRYRKVRGFKAQLTKLKIVNL